MRAESIVFEIRSVPKGDFPGGKRYLQGRVVDHPLKQLKGKDNLFYFINHTSYGIVYINIVDVTKQAEKPEKTSWNYDYTSKLLNWQQNKDLGLVIAEMQLSQESIPGLKNPYVVDIITINEDYRGTGLAKIMYQIIFNELKGTVVSGGSQTPGGKRNWMGLANIPGIIVRGYVQIANEDLEAAAVSEKRKTIIDQIMNLGGHYLGKDNDFTYWSFDVIPGTTQLKPVVKNMLSSLYVRNTEQYVTGLYATKSRSVREDPYSPGITNQYRKLKISKIKIGN